MKFLTKTLSSLLFITAISTTATAFEQNGVKEGNNRVSASVRFASPDEGDESLTFIGQYGKFVTDDIELMVDIFSFTNADTNYLLGLGANYYFMKNPTLTPYVGGQYFYSDSTQTGADYSANGSRFYLGTHKFLTENFAVTPEAGARFFDFTEYSESYLNVYLTYFFD